MYGLMAALLKAMSVDSTLNLLVAGYLVLQDEG